MSAIAIEFEPLPLALGLIGLCFTMGYLYWIRKYSTGFLVCFAFFWLYLLVVIKLKLFPIEIVPERARVFQEQGLSILTSGNLAPLFFGAYATHWSIFLAVSENILLTVPLGFGINFLTRVKSWDHLWPILAGAWELSYASWPSQSPWGILTAWWI